MDDLRETFADVSALIPRYSWEIMDEAQRDELMRNVVLPRYMCTTADGVQLGPTAWADMVGASAKSIESRVYRLRQSQKSDGDTPASTLSDQAAHRHARRVLRGADADTLAELIEDLPADRVEAIAQAAHKRQVSDIRGKTDGALPLDGAREKFDRLDRSWLLVNEMLIAFGRVRVAGIDEIVENLTATQRRELTERIPDIIAMLQHAEALAKTTKLKAVSV